MSSCCWCAWSISLPLFHYLSIHLFIRSLTHFLLVFSLSLCFPSGLSLSLSLSLSLYLNTLNQSFNGQKNRTCLILLLLLSPSPHFLTFSPPLSLSLSLSVFLCSLVSSCPWFLVKSVRQRKGDLPPLSLSAHLMGSVG